MRLTLMMTAVALSSGGNAKDLSKPVLSAACRTEITTLCPRVTDKAAHHACMKEKRSEVSEGCRTEMTALKAERRAARAKAPMAPATSNTTSSAPQ